MEELTMEGWTVYEGLSSEKLSVGSKLHLFSRSLTIYPLDVEDIQR